MPDQGPPTEFGGKVLKRHGVQPVPHVPTQSERLSLLYRTGDESGTTDYDPDGDGEAFAGLLPLDKQTESREREGVLKKGRVWEEMQKEGQAEVDELKPDESV